jgi:hypothetical protein
VAKDEELDNCVLGLRALSYVCAEWLLQVNRGNLADKSGDGFFVLLIMQSCHTTICVFVN